MSNDNLTNKDVKECKKLYFARIKKIFKKRFIPIIDDDMKCDNVDIFSSNKCLVAIDPCAFKSEVSQFIDNMNVECLYPYGDFSITFKKDETKIFKNISNTFFVYHNMLFFKNKKTARLIGVMKESMISKYGIEIGESFTSVYKKIYERTMPTNELSALHVDTYKIKINTIKGFNYGEESEHEKNK